MPKKKKSVSSTLLLKYYKEFGQNLVTYANIWRGMNTLKRIIRLTIEFPTNPTLLITDYCYIYMTIYFNQNGPQILHQPTTSNDYNLAIILLFPKSLKVTFALARRNYCKYCGNWITITLTSSREPRETDKSTSCLQAASG